MYASLCHSVFFTFQDLLQRRNWTIDVQLDQNINNFALLHDLLARMDKSKDILKETYIIDWPLA